jgi:hypothetical protein
MKMRVVTLNILFLFNILRTVNVRIRDGETIGIYIFLTPCGAAIRNGRAFLAFQEIPVVRVKQASHISPNYTVSTRIDFVASTNFSRAYMIHF